jgi:hypothetical protein
MGHLGLTISRDELVKLLGIPATTIYGWWQKGFIKPPKDPGSKQRQGTFTQDETFALFLFSLVVRTQKRRFEDAATVYRYLQHRQGALPILASVWPRPIVLTVYPAYDLVAFNFSEELIRIRDQQKVNFFSTDGRPENELEVNKQNREFWEKVNRVEAEKQRTKSSKDRGALVEVAFRIYKYRNGSIMTDGTVMKEYRHIVEAAALNAAFTYDHLTRDAWAMQYIEEGLDVSAWVNRYEGRHMTHFSLDVTKAVDRTAKLFDLPVKKD